MQYASSQLNCDRKNAYTALQLSYNGPLGPWAWVHCHPQKTISRAFMRVYRAFEIEKRAFIKKKRALDQHAICLFTTEL